MAWWNLTRLSGISKEMLCNYYYNHPLIISKLVSYTHVDTFTLYTIVFKQVAPKFLRKSHSKNIFKKQLLLSIISNIYQNSS